MNPFTAAARVLSREPSRSRDGTLLFDGTTPIACRVIPSRPDKPVAFGGMQVGARNSGYRFDVFEVEGSPFPRRPAHGDGASDRLTVGAQTFRFLDVQGESGGYFYVCDVSPV